jgi:hypothetical protein
MKAQYILHNSIYEAIHFFIFNNYLKLVIEALNYNKTFYGNTFQHSIQFLLLINTSQEPEMKLSKTFVM